MPLTDNKRGVHNLERNVTSIVQKLTQTLSGRFGDVLLKSTLSSRQLCPQVPDSFGQKVMAKCAKGVD